MPQSIQKPTILSRDEVRLLARLANDGQDGLVRSLLYIAAGAADVLMVNESVGFSDDPQVDAEVAAFVERQGARVVRVPRTGEPAAA
jgi:hypothetical protein